MSEHPDANLTRPFFMRSITASWITSVYISNAGMSGFSPRDPRSALAMFPTPDWIGRNEAGMRPALSSPTRKFATFSPILAVTSSTGANLPTSLGRFVWTTAMIFLGSTCTYGFPQRSDGL